MKRLLESRKLWGALLGSIMVIIGVWVTEPEYLSIVIPSIAGLWTIAITGQAFKDYKNDRTE